MAYRISYEWNREPKDTGKIRPSIGVMLGAALVTAAVAVRLLFPQTAQVFRELMHPLGDETTIAAFSEMVERIGHGTSVEDAVTVFCREILEHGQ